MSCDKEYDAFGRYAPFIQDFIYKNGWTELRETQIAACRVILDTDDNLLLSSGTASGKTEAAFLPALTELYEKSSSSVGILYISPLKALINDQFIRLEGLLDESGIPVCKWHGDASETNKNYLVKHPSGVLQITPESLESLLINKRGACMRLFSDLRFVIIDEVHHFMRNVRGVQVLCELERIQRLTGKSARRIGLSATLGDIEAAKNWLNTGSGRRCVAPVASENGRAIQLYAERFVKSGAEEGEQKSPFSGNEALYRYLFKMTLDKKTIIFTNSREETEFVMSNLREIAAKNKSPNVYRVHHGNVSAALREQTESEMKVSEEKIVTGATVTLELGIDIGSLDQVVQIGSPISVSSFAQRLGRCGRRGQVPRLLFTFVEEVQATANDWLGPFNSAFIRLIAIVELYVREHWIEPIVPLEHPYTIVYHQVLATLKSSGELSPARLAEEILSLKCFSGVSREDFKTLLTYMLETDQIAKTEEGGIIVGNEGEKIANHFHFYTVFKIADYYLVKDENRPIGTVDKIYPVGTRFSLAGMTWETVSINEKGKVIFVRKVPGVSLVDWNIDFQNELHTVLVRRIRDILLSDNDYRFLSPGCRERLAELRAISRGSGFLERLVSPISEHRFAVFPWIGTRQLVTLNFILRSKGIKSKLPWPTCICLEVFYQGDAVRLEALIYEILSENINLYGLNIPKEAFIDNKYNEFVPSSLLKKQFIEDYLDLEGLKHDLSESFHQSV